VLRGEHVPALAGHAVDALGCGDALLAAATLALTTGAPVLTSAFLGALAAGVQVQRLGNTVISAADLRQSAVMAHAAHLRFQPAESIAAHPCHRFRAEAELSA
jgi:bifunctional ADP-heptose synthase (sugar kinase/adenylyltransferase)